LKKNSSQCAKQAQVALVIWGESKRDKVKERDFEIFRKGVPFFLRKGDIRYLEK